MPATSSYSGSIEYSVNMVDTYLGWIYNYEIMGVPEDNIIPEISYYEISVLCVVKRKK